MREIPILPVERLLFRSELVAVGTYRCPAESRLFPENTPMANPAMVFPRTATTIVTERGGELVADPGVVMLYNRGEALKRRNLSGMDSSDWFEVDEGLLSSLVARFDPSVVDRPDRPFHLTRLPADGRLYLTQRLLLERAARRRPEESFSFEEAVIRMCEDVVSRSYARRPSRRRVTPSTREKVEAAKAILATDEGPLTLRRIATAVGTSPFHLCRAFAALTGSTMSDYRASQRLHRALERLRESVGLAELAFELGFSSHSHFTAAFRRRFGVTPSAFRAARPPRRPPSTESVRVAARHEPAFSASS